MSEKRLNWKNDRTTIRDELPNLPVRALFRLVFSLLIVTESNVADKSQSQAEQLQTKSWNQSF